MELKEYHNIYRRVINIIIRGTLLAVTLICSYSGPKTTIEGLQYVGATLDMVDTVTKPGSQPQSDAEGE